MATTKLLPASNTRLNLLYAPDAAIGERKPKSKITQAIQIDLTRDTAAEMLDSMRNGKGVYLNCGRRPILKWGNTSGVVRITPSASRHELYQRDMGNKQNLKFAGLVSHTARMKIAKEVMAGTDSALERLKEQMAGHAKDKAVNQMTFVDLKLDGSKRQLHGSGKNKQVNTLNQLLKKPILSNNTPARSLPSSPAVDRGYASHDPRSGYASTSSFNRPPLEGTLAKQKAQRFPLLHLLAIRPTSADLIKEKIHITQEECLEILQKVGKQTSDTASDWQITDRWFKELDVWRFPYSSQQDRQSAIDNAIRAYDRLRVSKEDELWQLLLPSSERGKGKTLSKLHLNGGPSQQPSNRTESDCTAAAHVKQKSDQSSLQLGTGGETMAGSKFQNQVKAKKLSEKEAQSKRLMSTKPAVSKPQTTAPRKAKSGDEMAKPADDRKNANPGDEERNSAKVVKAGQKRKAASKLLSTEFVNDSDEEESPDIDEILALSSGSDRKRLKTNSGAAKPNAINSTTMSKADGATPKTVTTLKDKESTTRKHQKEVENSVEKTVNGIGGKPMPNGQDSNKQVSNRQEREKQRSNGQDSNKHILNGQNKEKQLSNGQNKEKQLSNGQNMQKQLSNGQDTKKQMSNGQDREKQMPNGQDSMKQITNNKSNAKPGAAMKSAKESVEAREKPTNVNFTAGKKQPSANDNIAPKPAVPSTKLVGAAETQKGGTVPLKQPSAKPTPAMKPYKPSEPSSKTWFSSISGKPMSSHRPSSSQSSNSSAISTSLPSAKKRPAENESSISAPESKRRRMSTTPNKPSPLGSSPQNASDHNGQTPMSPPADRLTSPPGSSLVGTESLPLLPLAELKKQTSDAFFDYVQLRRALEDQGIFPTAKRDEAWEKYRRAASLKREVDRAEGTIDSSEAFFAALPNTFPKGTAASFREIWNRKRVEYTKLRGAAPSLPSDEQKSELWKMKWELEDLTTLYKAAKEEERLAGIKAGTEDAAIKEVNGDAGITKINGHADIKEVNGNVNQDGNTTHVDDEKARDAGK